MGWFVDLCHLISSSDFVRWKGTIGMDRDCSTKMVKGKRDLTTYCLDLTGWAMVA